MNEHVKGSKSAVWVFLPILLAIIVSAIFGLQLFQDGSSYLFELLVSHSAVRHGRVSAWLFQLPTIFLIKAVSRLNIDSLAALPFLRLAFNLNYGVTPFISLLLAWLVVRNKEERLFIWAALIVLFVNLVNFSWVSELLISLQLSCPLLLALIQNPRSKTFWLLLVLILPFIFFLHPLVIAIYLTLAAVSAFTGHRYAEYRIPARVSLIVFLSAAVLRGIYSLFALSGYEVSFLSSGEARSYLISSSLENVLFLVIALEIAVLILLAPFIIHSKGRIAGILPRLIKLQSLALFLFAARSLLDANLSLVATAGYLGVTVFTLSRVPRNKTRVEVLRRLYLSFGTLAVAATALFLSQFLFFEKTFQLKTGLSLFAALLLMLLATVDGYHHPTPRENALRLRLAITLAILFSCAIIAKALMWQVSVDQLQKTLGQAQASCVEITPSDFRWLDNNPHKIINNWALPSLALVVQDHRPRKLLLEENDCQLYYQSRIVQVDPWSLLEEKYIVPPLD